MSPSEILGVVAAGIVLLLFHVMWIGAIMRDFWRWGDYMKFCLAAGCVVGVDTFLAGVILAVLGK